MGIAELDEQIDALQIWILKAGRALISFYDNETGTFWEGTIIKDTKSKQGVPPTAADSNQSVTSDAETKKNLLPTAAENKVNVSSDDDEKTIHPTATNRAFFALYEYLRFIEEENIDEEDLEELKTMLAKKMGEEKPKKKPKDRLACILVDITEKYLKLVLTPEGLFRARNSPYNEVNMLTDSHLSMSIALLKGTKLRNAVKSVDVNKIVDAVTKEVVETNKTSLLKARGGKVHKNDQGNGKVPGTDKEGHKNQEFEEEKHNIHDFVTLHAIRAFDAFDRTWDPTTDAAIDAEKERRAKIDAEIDAEKDEGEKRAKIDAEKERRAEIEVCAKEISKLRIRIEEEVLRQLAFYFADVGSRFDPTYLALTISLMNRFSTTDVLELTRRSVDTIAKSQTADGGWPTPLYVTSTGGAWLQIASYEVALTLTDLLLRYLHKGNDDAICDALLPALARTFDLGRVCKVW